MPCCMHHAGLELLDVFQSSAQDLAQAVDTSELSFSRTNFSQMDAVTI